MDLLRYGAPPDLPAASACAGLYRGVAQPVDARAVPDEGPLARLPVRRAGRPSGVDALGDEWSSEVLRCFAECHRPDPEPGQSDLRLAMLVRVLYLSPELHNLVARAIRDLSFAVALPAAAALGRQQPRAELFTSDADTREIDACLAARGTRFFVLRNLIARKLPPVAGLVRGALAALGRPADAQRCADCVDAAVEAFGHADFSRERADAGLGALRRLGRELEDNLRLLALDLDDAQPPLDDVAAGHRPPEALGLWLIGMQADLVQFAAFDFHENADRPDRAAAMYERVVVRLGRKVGQCIRVIDRLRPDSALPQGLLPGDGAWRDTIADMRAAPDRERRKACFHRAITLLGHLLRNRLEAVPTVIQGPAAFLPALPLADVPDLPALPELPAPVTPGPDPRPHAPVLAPERRQAPLPVAAIHPTRPQPLAPLAARLQRQASLTVWLDLQGTRKKITRLYEGLHSTPPDPDGAEVLAALLPHIDELSRGNRSLGLVFIRLLLLVLERQPDAALYDRAVFSAARNLEAMPIDQHARRFFDSPLANVLALLRALRRAAPEQAGLFLETLDLCLSHRENLGLTDRLRNELAAMPEPYDSELLAQAPRFALAGMLHALAPHAASEPGAALACRLAEALGYPLPATGLRNPQALAEFACRLLLEASHFHRAEVPRSGRLPAHRFLNLHDVGGLALPLLQAVPHDGRPLRVTVGGFGHQKGEEMPATRRTVLDWASDRGMKVQSRGAADLWVTREPDARGGVA